MSFLNHTLNSWISLESINVWNCQSKNQIHHYNWHFQQKQQKNNFSNPLIAIWIFNIDEIICVFIFSKKHCYHLKYILNYIAMIENLFMFKIPKIVFFFMQKNKGHKGQDVYLVCNKMNLTNGWYNTECFLASNEIYFNRDYNPLLLLNATKYFWAG